jgi:DNA repair exonuclease SbcCD ATPase subunit
MDASIFILGFAFVGIVAAAAYFLFKEDSGGSPTSTPARPTAPAVNANPAAQLQRKIAQTEERFKNLQIDHESIQLELAQTKERERAIAKERSEIVFDKQQYERFLKDHAVLKIELKQKEDAVEKEISLRRQQATELAQVQQSFETTRQRLTQTEDELRKSKLTVETLQKDLIDAKKILSSQNRIVEEHVVNKTEGEWVSREEFHKLENELREKDTLLKKMLSLPEKKEPTP